MLFISFTPSKRQNIKNERADRIMVRIKARFSDKPVRLLLKKNIHTRRPAGDSGIKASDAQDESAETSTTKGGALQRAKAYLR